MRLIVVALGLWLAVEACRTAPRADVGVWVKPGGTKAELDAAYFDCETRVATKFGWPYTLLGTGWAMAEADVRRCMLTKGWRLQEHPY